MEKSNETLPPKQSPGNSSDLALTSRRLLLAKRFFSWIAALYFSISLIAAGGLFTEITVPLAKAGRPVFYFAVSALLYSLIAYGLTTAWDGVAKLRFPVLVIIAAIFLAAMAHSFGLLG